MALHVNLSKEAEDRLRAEAERLGMALEEYAARLLEESSPEPVGIINSTPHVMGGDACIRNTRVPVWTLVDYKQQGLTDSELLAAFPSLNAADLVAAWDYYATHSKEVDKQKKRHEGAA